MSNQKKCFKCNTIRLYDYFYPSSKTKDRLRSQCKICEAAYQSEWRRKNPTYCREYQSQWDANHSVQKEARMKQQAAKRKNNAARRRDLLLALQQGRCKICGADNSGNLNGWHLDHDHQCCNKPIERSCGRCDRGVLCYRCNVILVGNLERDKSLIPIILSYIGIELPEAAIKECLK